MQRPGVAMVANLADENAVYLWARGPSIIRDGTIYLDTSRIKDYMLLEAMPVALDLASLHPVTEEKALEFVARYGLLIEDRDSKQDLGDLAKKAAQFHNFVTLRQKLLRAVNGDLKALEFWLEEIYELYMQAVEFLGNPSLSDEEKRKAQEMVDYYIAGRYGADRSVPLTEAQEFEVLDAASRILANLITRSLRPVTVSVTSETTLAQQGIIHRKIARPGVFTIEHRVANLLGFAYLRLAYLFVDKSPILECLSCGKFFEKGDRRRIYCSNACAVNERKKRMKEKRGKMESAQ